MQTPGTHQTIAIHQGAPLCSAIGPWNSEHESALSWVAVYAKQHHEKRVAEYLIDQALDCYLPLYTSKRKWSNHRTAIIEMPLFPTYLFARISPRMRTRILR